MPPFTLSPQNRARSVTAVLGPTNTGKTHLAIERMMGHSSGLIGLPLRLLAREVYGRVVERVGADAVALITGEEKIKPPNPRYWIATAEAMPRDLDVAFVAIDEIQLAAGHDRGHVFTDHLLNRRGREETLVIGSSTMKPMVEALLPGANIVSRPRLSQLTYAGEKKLTRLPPRTAIVAFSAEEVYSIAELMRRQRGGAAVVLGALSPRTRNAQVELFQSGDVGHIIATDAIGMGLNLDIHHVAFAGGSKFDGHSNRRLTTAEFGQIAGRAGRHLQDGTFGTSGRCPPFDPDLIDNLENHIFEPVRMINWRNPDLDLRSLDALRKSLALAPNEPGLMRAPRADDEVVFELAASDDDIRAKIQSRDGVTRLWEMCSLPDYRKVAPHAHAELIGQIFGFITAKGSIPDDWFQRQVNLCDRIDGDIDTLSARIAQIRTWTFCANRDWLRQPLHWQGVTRTIEDKLSDALHEKLTARFVDRRTSVLMRRLRENAMLEADVNASGDVTVEGQPVGRLQGFRFTPEAGATGTEAKAMAAAALKALAGEIDMRASKLSAASDEAFALALDGTFRWIGEPVAKLQAGDKVLEPRFVVLADEQLSGAARESVEARLVLWLKTHINKLLGPLLVLEAGEGLAGIGRGIAYQLAEHLGVLERNTVATEMKTLDQESRSALRKMGVRFGAYHITTPMLLKPAPRALAAQLWVLKHGGVEVKGLDDIAHLASSGRTSFAVDLDVPKALYRAAGFRVCGPRAIRVDILERLADIIRPAIAFKPGTTPGDLVAGAYSGDGFTVTGAMTSLAGCAGEDFAAVLQGLGYKSEKKPPLKNIAVVPLAVAATAPLVVEITEQSADTEVVEASAEQLEGVAVALVAELPVEVSSEELSVEVVQAATDEAKVALESSAIVEAAAEAESIVVIPDLIDVWRPARFEREQRPRSDQANARPRGQGRDQGRSQGRNNRSPSDIGRIPNRQAPSAVVPGDPSAASVGDISNRGRREGQPASGGKPWQRRDKREGEGAAQPHKPFAGGRPSPGKFDGSKPDSFRRDKPRFDQRSGGQQVVEKPREKVADPDSPFAQLAALKAQLEGKK